jgi:WD40 repeat protein
MKIEGIFPIYSIDVSSDGAHLVTGGEERVVRLWNTETGELERALTRHGDIVTAVAFDPSNEQVASASLDRSVRIWDLRENREVKSFAGHVDAVRALSFDASGDRLASGAADHTVKLWSTREDPASTELTGHRFVPGCVAWSPDGRKLATGGDDNSIRVWDRETGLCAFAIYGHSDPVVDIAWTRDGSEIISASLDRYLAAWDANNGEPRRRYVGHEKDVKGVALAPDGSELYSIALDRTLRAWRREVATESRVLATFDAEPSAVAVSNDGASVAVGLANGMLLVVDAKTGRERKSIMAHVGRSPRIRSLAFDSGGTRLASASIDHTTKIWDANSGDLVAVLEGHSNEVVAASFQPGGARLVTGSSDGFAIVWDTLTWAKLLTLRGHVSQITDALFSPDGACVATCSYDLTVRLWDTQRAPDFLERRLAAREEERRLAPILEELYAREGITPAVLSALLKRADLGESDRATLARMARSRADDPIGMQPGIWACVRSPDRRPEEYALALVKAQRARDLNPFVLESPTTLGGALLRNGKYTEALQALARGKFDAQRNPEQYAESAAFRTLALLALGRVDEARAASKDMHAGAASLPNASAANLSDLIAEVEHALEGR